MDLLIVQEYDIREDAYCLKNHNIFTTLSDAQKQCTDDPSCTMVYYNAAGGQHFHLCDEDATIETSTYGSRLYIKRKGIRDRV